MEISTVISLVGVAVTVILAWVAIWYSYQAERKSLRNYERTRDALAEITTKAAVIETTVSGTQEKLVDTITSIAKPKEESENEMLMKLLIPMMAQNPEMLNTLIGLGEKQKGKN